MGFLDDLDGLAKGLDKAGKETSSCGCGMMAVGLIMLIALLFLIC